MIASALPATELDVFTQVIGPDETPLSEELSRSLLAMRFTAEAEANIRSLLDKNNRGQLSTTEREALDRYLRVGQFIDLLQAQARIRLQQSAGA